MHAVGVHVFTTVWLFVHVGVSREGPISSR